MLDCRSEGWYPEPEVVWLDGEGNLLSAGPTETVRGPDDLYTVSSRVTVEKRHSNNFTCRVQQKDINQTRETHIQITGFIISEECATASSSAARICIILAVVFICILAVVIIWKWQHNKTRIMMNPVDGTEQTGQREQLMADSEEKKTNGDKQLQKKEEEQKDFVLVVQTLKEQMLELEKLKDQLKSQNEDMERQKEESEKKLQSVEKESEQDRAKGYWKLTEIILQDKRTIGQRKTKHDKLLLNTQMLLNRGEGVLQKIKIREPHGENQCVTGEKETGS
ncbi:butyrophilin subfamily 2 member A2-like [Morone saxatilis]|uniref:butyrophilin subfamily 2 member A2-like n=1 Tax=Morone saxatilis TaxID=34816 RepID=UPI0015E208F7|nr:butyrophilin subfamily 2 member A2-like [Morone saxatilis]